MKFLCGSCRTKYQISDEKVRGKILTIRCKKCGAKVMVKESLTRQGDVVIAPVSEEQKLRAAEVEMARAEASHGMAKAAGTLSSAFDVAMRAAPDDMPTAIAPTPSNQAEAGVEWYTAADGKQLGPYAFGELVQRVRDGLVQPRHYVWRDGYDGWKRVRDIPDLAQLLPQDKKRPPPPPPMAVEPSGNNVVDFASRRAERERSQAPVELDEDPTRLERAHVDAPARDSTGRAEELDSVLNDALGIAGEGATTRESPKNTAGQDRALDAIAASSAIFTSSSESSVPSAVPEDLFDMVPRASSQELVSRESTRFFVQAAGVQHQKSRDRLGVFIGFAAALLLVGFFGLWGTGVIAISIPGLGNPFARAATEAEEAPQDEAELTELERQMLEGLKGQERARAAQKIVRQRRTGSGSKAQGSGIEYVSENGSGAVARGSRTGEGGAVGIDLATETEVPEASLARIDLPGGNPSEVPLPDTNRLDEGMITQVVNANRKAIALCYQKALKGAGPDGLGGKVTFQVTVEPDGSVSKARVAAGKFQGTEIARCMTAKMRDWRFPAFRGPAQNIEIPVVLQQSAF